MSEVCCAFAGHKSDAEFPPTAARRPRQRTLVVEFSDAMPSNTVTTS